MKQVSYWLDTAPVGPDYTGTALPDVVDVAIVGGGLTGLSAALHLRRKGANVAVLEAERLGWGASGRNGGMATTGLTISLLKAIDRYGIETAERMYDDFDRAIETVEGLVREHDIDCSFVRAGKLSLAVKPSHYELLAKTYDILTNRFGREALLVPKAQIRSEIGSDYYAGALVDPLAAGLHVGRFVRGLATAAGGAGASLHEAARVRSITGPDGAKVVQTSRGDVRAKQVLVATDGYTDGAVGRYRRRVVPVGSFIVATEPLDRALIDDLMPTRRMASDSKNLVFYFRITPDDRMLFGGRARFALSNPTSDLRSAKILQQGMLEVFPQLAGARIDYAWGGLVGMTLDRMPHAGEHDGIFYSMGYNGHGVQMATYMGRQMAEMMDGDPEANPFRGLRFRAVPGHFGPPWFLPFADVYYRFRDAIS